MKKNNIKEVGNEKLGVKIYHYDTNQWETVNVITASNTNLTFEVGNETSNDNFIKVEKFGTEQFGYYFYYKHWGKTYSQAG